MLNAVSRAVKFDWQMRYEVVRVLPCRFEFATCRNEAEWPGGLAPVVNRFIRMSADALNPFLLALDPLNAVGPRLLVYAIKSSAISTIDF